MEQDTKNWQYNTKIMKTVLFLVRKDKISIRRYLLVAKQLKKLDVDFCFLNFTDHADIVEECVKELELHDLLKTRIYCYKDPRLLYAVSLLIAKIKKHILRKGGSGEQKKNTDFQVGKRGDDIFEALLKQLNFDTDVIVRQYYEGNIDWWRAHIRLARDKIKKIKPACIVYDLEMSPFVRSFLYAAKKERVKIVSMQHGAGFAEQYCNFPRVADYYIAYSPYGLEIIKKLEVEDENIFLTGVPDIDLVFDYDIVKIKNELSSKYNLSFDKKIILVALRPTNQDSLKDINVILMNTVFDILGNDERFEILIKPHNKDYFSGAPFSYRNVNYNNVKIIDNDFSFLKTLKISHYLITHMSTCVVEAVLLGVPSIVVEFDYGTMRWPPWDDYNVFHSTSTPYLERVLTEIKHNKYNFRPTREAREKFLERFTYKSDNKSADRIAGVIENII